MGGKFIPGIHHDTAIASNPQRNLDFYTLVLGLRLVKVTVNLDSPGTYHFNFGDESSGPGTVMTFFPWPDANRGRIGNGQVGASAFSIPEGSVGYWQEHLKQFGVTTSLPNRRFDEEALVLADPDGRRPELVAQAYAPEISPWRSGPVPNDYAIRGLLSVTLWEVVKERTAKTLTEILDFEQVAEGANRTRFKLHGCRPGTTVDIFHRPDGSRGTGVKDRHYFRSIYFREPGGLLLEIATDSPGFRLPPWLDSKRDQIESTLPEIELPTIRTSLISCATGEAGKALYSPTQRLYSTMKGRSRFA